MSTIQDKIAKAKAAGYSDADIAAHLADSPEYGGKIKQAKDAGYKPEEIVAHLAGTPATAPQASPASSGGIGAAVVDGVKGLGAGAGKAFGGTVLGLQRLAGKGLEAAGASTVGKWLVNDADAGRAKLERENALYKAASPLANATGEVAGSIVATLPVGAVLPNALRTAAGAKTAIGIGRRAGQAAGVGAVYGGVTGTTGSTADTVGGMLADGARGAGTGAAFGGVATPATAALGAVAGNVAQRFSKTSAAEYAKQKIAEAFARDARGEYFTSGAGNPLVQASRKFVRLGDEARLVDAGGDSTHQLLDTLATLPGRTKNAVSIAQRQRAAGSGARMRAAAEDALDTQGQRLPTTVEALITRRKKDSGPLYKQLRQVEIDPSPELAETVAAADKLGAVTLARKIATARQDPFTLDVGAPSKWSMRDLDAVKQGIDQKLVSHEAKHADGTLTPLGEAYLQLKNTLIPMLDAATTNPKTGESLYRSAREAFAEPSKLIDAGKAGQWAINQGETSIRNAMQGMSANELQAFRIGAFEGLREKLGTQGGRTNIMNMWQEPSTQERLKAVFGDLRSYRKFALDVAKEKELKQFQAIAKGSQTASRHAAMGDLDLAAAKEVGHSAAALKSGNVLSAIGSAKSAWNRVATPQSVRDQMGSMLLDRGATGARNLNSLEALVQSINNRNLLLSNNVGMLGGQVGGKIVAPPQQLK